MPNGANNRLTRWGGKTYSYDPNGNLLADGTHSYQWNERNQLTGLSAGATSLASFSYDSLGRRSAKTVAGATTGFVYDGDTFVQELLGASSNSAVKAQLLTGGIDETFLRIEGASRVSDRRNQATSESAYSGHLSAVSGRQHSRHTPASAESA